MVSKKKLLGVRSIRFIVCAACAVSLYLNYIPLVDNCYMGRVELIGLISSGTVNDISGFVLLLSVIEQ